MQNTQTVILNIDYIPIIIGIIIIILLIFKVPVKSIVSLASAHLKLKLVPGAENQPAVLSKARGMQSPQHLGEKKPPTKHSNFVGMKKLTRVWLTGQRREAATGKRRVA